MSNIENNIIKVTYGPLTVETDLDEQILDRIFGDSDDDSDE